MQRFRIATLLAALALVLTLVACDTAGYDDHVHESDALIISFNTDFRMADAALNGSVASVTYDVPDLTPRIVDGGVVLAYFWEQGTWTAMPYTYGVDSQDLAAVDYTVSLGYAFATRTLEVFYEASTDQIDLAQLPDRRIKVVLLDAAVALGKNLDYTDWNQVQEAYGLSD
jgi:hypothetical protein